MLAWYMRDLHIACAMKIHNRRGLGQTCKETTLKGSNRNTYAIKSACSSLILGRKGNTFRRTAAYATNFMSRDYKANFCFVFNLFHLQ